MCTLKAVFKTNLLNNEILLPLHLWNAVKYKAVFDLMVLQHNFCWWLYLSNFKQPIAVWTVRIKSSFCEQYLFMIIPSPFMKFMTLKVWHWRNSFISIIFMISFYLLHDFFDHLQPRHSPKRKDTCIIAFKFKRFVFLERNFH